MKPEDLLKQVRKALSEVNRCLTEGTFSQAKEGYPDPSELEVICEELQRVETELVTGKVPEKSRRMLAIGRIITDTWWNYDKEPLSEKLMEISDNYKRKLKE